MEAEAQRGTRAHWSARRPWYGRVQGSEASWETIITTMRPKMLHVTLWLQVRDIDAAEWTWCGQSN